MFGKDHPRAANHGRVHVERSRIGVGQKLDAVFRQNPAHRIDVFTAEIGVDRLGRRLVQRNADHQRGDDRNRDAGDDADLLAGIEPVQNIDEIEQASLDIHVTSTMKAPWISYLA